MSKYGLNKKKLEHKENETKQDHSKRMYDATCKFYDYIGW